MTTDAPLHRVSVVVPVYQGERALEPLLAELEPWTKPTTTPRGVTFHVLEVVLVHDGAIDRSDVVMKALAARYPFVRLVWLSRNFGQHPATLAGMAVTSGDWVATLDEDGLHDPDDIGRLLDRAVDRGVPLVYGQPSNAPPHGVLRNVMSRVAKRVAGAIAGSPQMAQFSSFRFIRGDIARSLAAYCGHGVYLDIALSWVVGRWDVCPVTFRPERGRPSGYGLRSLLAHFGRLLLTAGTRPLRVITALGCFSVLVAVVLSVVVVWEKLAHKIPVQGYASLVIIICYFSGIILLVLGTMAEYLALTLTMAMGRPPYVTVADPPQGPDR